MKKKSINYFLSTALFLLFISGSVLQAQSVVTGKVFPAGSETPMSNVNIQLMGYDNLVATTDQNGYFKLAIPEESGDMSIRVSTPGYENKVIDIKKNQDLNITLFAQDITNDYGKSVAISTKLEPESRDGILVLESADKRFKYWFDTRVYLDGATYFGDASEIGNGVNIRRARFGIKTILWGHWGGEFDMDFAYNEVDLKDAYIRYISDNWQIKAGNFKEPFSMETTTTSRYITFVERPMITELAPSRHLGVTFRKTGNKYFFEGGLFSSTIANELIQDENKSKGTSAGFSVTGRFAYAPIKKDKQVLHLAAAGSYRTPKIPELGDPANAFRFNTRAETSINRKKYLDTDFVEDAKYMTLFGLEAAYAYKNFKVVGEYMQSDITRDKDKVAVGEDKTGVKGFYVAGCWLINNADYYYNMGEAEFNQIDFRNIEKGALELALRYDYTDANSFKDGSDIPFVQGGASEGYTVGINYYFNLNVKFMLDYTYINNDRWADGKGKYANDKTAPTGEGGIDFSIIQARVEIDF
jgi:phosphate-selective porin OprO/OprP